MTRTQQVTLAGAGLAVLGFVIWAAAASWSPEAWAALAAWATVGVAAAAGYIALGQLNEAARLRREQAQPYVVAYIETSPAAPMFVEIVLKNFGATAAHDVRLTITPAPTRAIDLNRPPEHVWLPDRLPVLVPGQQWRTLWDSGIQRYQEGRDLPEHHEATVSYEDSSGVAYSTAAVLDWGMLRQRDPVHVYGEHDTAQALRGISKTVASWTEGTRGLSVFARDGDAKDESVRQRREERLAERERERKAADGGKEQEAHRPKHQG